MRDARAAETRRTILEAVVRTMGEGIAELSVPAVAREAGVSVKTIYRHFGSKSGLVAALSGYFWSRADMEQVRVPHAVDDLETAIRDLFHRLDGMDDMARAVLATDMGWRARRATLPTRLRMLRAPLEALPNLTDESREHLVRLGLILTSSFSLSAWKDYLGVDADEAATEVAWALRSAIAGAERVA